MQVYSQYIVWYSIFYTPVDVIIYQKRGEHHATIPHSHAYAQFAQPPYVLRLLDVIYKHRTPIIISLMYACYTTSIISLGGKCTSKMPTSYKMIRSEPQWINTEGSTV